MIDVIVENLQAEISSLKKSIALMVIAIPPALELTSQLLENVSEIEFKSVCHDLDVQILHKLRLEDELLLERCSKFMSSNPFIEYFLSLLPIFLNSNPVVCRVPILIV